METTSAISGCDAKKQLVLGIELRDFFEEKVGVESDFRTVLGAALTKLGKFDPTYLRWLRQNVRSMMFAPSLRPNRYEEGDRRLVFGQQWRVWFERSRVDSEVLAVCVLTHYATLLETRRRLKSDLKAWQERPFETAANKAICMRFRIAPMADNACETMLTEWGDLDSGGAGWLGERSSLLKYGTKLVRDFLRH